MDKEKELVIQAKKGNQAAVMQLLENYGFRENDWTSFLGKYYDLLRFGKINLKDKDTRRFLQLYIKDADLRKKLVYHFQDYVGALVGKETADYLQNKVSIIPIEDLKQDLVLLFLEVLDKYVDTGVAFSGYLYNAYRYKVFECLRKKVFKFEWFHHPQFTYLEEDVADEKNIIEPRESWFDRFYASESKRDQLGIFWINGRCASVFEGLSVFERTLLRDRYLYKKTDGEIAKEYGYHINTIYKRRHLAIKKLKQKKETLSD